MPAMRFHLTPAAVAALLLFRIPTQAAVRTWTGATDSNWNKASNWSPAVVPVALDDLVFPHDAIRKTTYNNISEGFHAGSIRFAGSTANYVVQGLGIRLSVGTLDIDKVRFFDEHTVGNLRFEADLSLSGHVQFEAAGSLGFYGTVRGASGSSAWFRGAGSVSTWGPLEILPILSEVDSFTVAGNTENSTPAFIKLMGEGRNLYLARPGGILGWSGDVYVGESSAPAREMTVWPLFENAFGRDLRLSGAGQVVLNDVAQSVESIHFNTGGVIDTGPAQLSVQDSVQVDGTPTGSRTATIRGRLGLDAGDIPIRTGATTLIQPPRNQTNLFLATRGLQSALNIEASVFAAPLAIGLTDPGIRKGGVSVLRLSNRNTFTGWVRVEQGLLEILHPEALGTTATPTAIHLNGGVLLSGVSCAEPFILDDAAPGLEAVAARVSGHLPQLLGTDGASASGPMTFDVDGGISAAPGTFTVASAMTGAGGVHYNQLVPPASNLVDDTTNGVIRLTGSSANTYLGTTTIHRGRVELARTGDTVTIPGDLVVGDPDGSPALLDVLSPLQLRNGHDLFLHPGGTVRNPGAHFATIEGSGTLDIANSFASVGLSGLDSTFAGAIVGTGPLIKTGTGILSLSGTNPFPGKVEVNTGTVEVSGSLENLDLKIEGSPLATLSGNGRARDLAFGPRGRLSPGVGNGVDSLARLTVRNLRLDDAGAIARFDAAGATVVSGHDQVRVTDAVRLGGRLALFATFQPQAGDRLRLIDKTSAGPIIGTFIDLPEAGMLTNQALIWRATYAGGDGNDFVLEYIGTTNPPPNLPPALNSPATAQLVEGMPADILATASDPNPGQSVRFRLDGDIPVGVSIDRDSGRLQWTPGERQGGRTFEFGIVAADDAVPSLRTTNRIAVTVLESNLPPTLRIASRHTVLEGNQLDLSPGASDPDEPAQLLTWDIVGTAPNGLTVDAQTGRVLWTPGELQAPSTNEVTLRVRDSGSPRASATRVLRIVAIESNSPPVLMVPGDAVLTVGEAWTTDVVATDPDRPLQSLTFRAAGPLPEGMTLNASTGRIRWTPAASQAGTHVIRVAVEDDGEPALRENGRFSLTVQARPGRPVLEAVLDTTLEPVQVRFSWPTTASGFELQFNPDPTAAEGWQPIANPSAITFEGDRSVFRPGAGAGARFYRLHRP